MQFEMRDGTVEHFPGRVQIGDHDRGAAQDPQVLDGGLVCDVGHYGDGPRVHRVPEVGVRPVHQGRPMRHQGEGLDQGDGELPGGQNNLPYSYVSY